MCICLFLFLCMQHWCFLINMMWIQLILSLCDSHLFIACKNSVSINILRKLLTCISSWYMRSAICLFRTTHKAEESPTGKTSAVSLVSVTTKKTHPEMLFPCPSRWKMKLELIWEWKRCSWRWNLMKIRQCGRGRLYFRAVHLSELEGLWSCRQWQNAGSIICIFMSKLKLAKFKISSQVISHDRKLEMGNSIILWLECHL